MDSHLLVFLLKLRYIHWTRNSIVIQCFPKLRAPFYRAPEILCAIEMKFAYGQRDRGERNAQLFCNLMQHQCRWGGRGLANLLIDAMSAIRERNSYFRGDEIFIKVKGFGTNNVDEKNAQT